MTITLGTATARRNTWARIAALLVTIVLLTGLTYLGVSSSPETVSVSQGAHAGQLTMHPCTYPTENGAYRADCGTLVVPENRANPRSRLIALPVIRILARSSHPLAPIFHLSGGPGITNMTFPQANRLAAQHGHQVILSGLGHVDDFWPYEPSASTQLLTTFYATGQVDTSRYTPNKVTFTPPTTQTSVAKDILGAVIGVVVLAALWLLWLALRVRKHGSAGHKTSVLARTIVPVVLGLGGFFGAALVVLTLWPALSLASELLGILAPSGLIALGLYLAWTHRDWDRATKSLGLLAAIAGALLGGWLGFTATSGLFALVTTTIGAAAGGNLALIAVSLVRERSARGHGNDPAATYAVAPAPGSPAAHAAHHGDAHHGSAEGP